MAWEKLGSASVGGAVANTSWKLLARGTGSGTTVDTGTFTAKDNIMVLGHSPNGTQYVTYNNDTGSNYANRRNEEGASDSAQTSRTSISFTRNAGEDLFFVGDLLNIATQEKLGVYHQVSQNSAGAGNAPKRQEWSHKWANTSDQITRVTMTSDSGNYTSDDEIVVLGYDTDEADSGTNFWQELASVELSSSATTISSGTISAKKYLMFELFTKPTGGQADPRPIFNSDSGSNYAYRFSQNGGTDSTVTNSTTLDPLRMGESQNPAYGTGFIINKADKEKLMITHAINRESSGATNAPFRSEGVGKWTNTSNQITDITFVISGAGSFDTGSYLKVYGAD